jgi:hypothetical protein
MSSPLLVEEVEQVLRVFVFVLEARWFPTVEDLADRRAEFSAAVRVFSFRAALAFIIIIVALGQKCADRCAAEPGPQLSYPIVVYGHRRSRQSRKECAGIVQVAYVVFRVGRLAVGVPRCREAA